ncbi:TetR/AcrR family transcriptional regulator [Spirillospora sp. CA-253888]
MREKSADRTAAIMRTTLELGQEIGYARLSIDAVAARAGVSKTTIYRRWSSKGALFVDSLLSVNKSEMDYLDTGDVIADLRRQIHAAIDLLDRPPMGPLFKALISEALLDPQVSAAFNDHFITPQREKTLARLRSAQAAGQLSPDYDMDMAMDILSGPLYFRALITQKQLTHGYVDRMIDALFVGMAPRP